MITHTISKHIENPIVAVVIPAYNVAEHILEVLVGIPRFVSHIIVVNDCSSDETAELVRAWDDTRVQLLSHTENQGVGGATLSGYDLAYKLGANVIVKFDGDNQMDPTFLPSNISPIMLGEADYSKGNRFLQPNELRIMPWTRRAGNLTLSFLTKLASGYWDIFDPTNGYTAISSELVPNLNKKALDRRYFFETSMLIELGLQQAVVRDVNIPARYGEEVSSLSEVKAFFEFPHRLLKGFTRRILILYFLRDFNAFSIFSVFGLLLLIFGLIWGSYHWIRSVQLARPTPTGTVMLAVLPVILGIQFLLQALVIDIQNIPTRPLQMREQAGVIEKFFRKVNKND